MEMLKRRQTGQKQLPPMYNICNLVSAGREIVHYGCVLSVQHRLKGFLSAWSGYDASNIYGV